jgi:hypothetical protein
MKQTTRTTTWLVAAITAASLQITAQAANPVMNGDFETTPPNFYGAIPNWNQVPNPSGYSGYDYLSGAEGKWEDGGVSAWDNGYVPGTDRLTNKVAFIETFVGGGGSVPTLSLKQTVTGLTIGTVYELSYYENSRANPALNNPTAETFVGGASVVAAHLVTPVNSQHEYSNPFHHRTTLFTATAESMELEFRATQLNGNDTFLAIDNVTITPQGRNFVMNGDFETASPGYYGGIPDWNQVPNPSGYSGYDYLSGAEGKWENGGVGPWDNGHVPGTNRLTNNVAFIETFVGDGGSVPTLSLKQTVTGLTVGQVYQLSYNENGYANPAVNNPTAETFVGGASVVAAHLVTPVNSRFEYTNPFYYRTALFTATANSMELEFRATQLNGNDTFLVIDNVAIYAVGMGAYAGWATANAGGQAANLDWDNDGVPNGVEYFMNAAPGFTANPGFVGNTVTWTNGGIIPSSDYGIQFVVQTSSDLVTWDDVTEGDLDQNGTNTASSLSYTLDPVNNPGKQFVRLKVTPN